MSFTLFDREGKEPLGLPQFREPCVCSPAETYCLVCRVWDIEQRQKEDTRVSVCFADGEPFMTSIPAELIQQVHTFKEAGWTLRSIAAHLNLKSAKVRAISRMRLLEEE